MSSQHGDDRTDRWRRRPAAGLLLRAFALLIPFAASLASIVVLTRLVPRPHDVAIVPWYLGICAVSWLVLALSQGPLRRLLPLAVLMELALVFPDTAPSRAQLAKRAGSTRALHQLLAAPENETVQQAAERVLALVGALAKHDRKTRGHAERVRALTDLLAERMALPQADRDRLRWAALLHDIGKLTVASSLLNKDGKPNAQEWEIIRRHPEHGAQIAAPLMEWLEGWGDVIVQHHERWDGAGYPHGLAGSEICLGARIVAVADAYDVMTSTRAYKKPIGRAAAMRELTRYAGSQFDPEVVRAMFAVSSRRLVVAVGPLSWISGIPFVGQTASASMLQTGTALGAAALTGAAALSPAFDLSTAPHPAPFAVPTAHPHSHEASARPAGPVTTDVSLSGTGSAASTPAPKRSATHRRKNVAAKPTAKPTARPTQTARPTKAPRPAPTTKSTSPAPVPSPTSRTTAPAPVPTHTPPAPHPTH